jgi:iron complex transport system substrate-binding protein
MYRKSFFAFVMLVLVLTACNPIRVDMTPTAPPSLAPITLTDGLSRTVSLSAPARRVVSLAASNTEILFAVGAGAQVVGRDMFSDYPAEAASVQDIGGSMGEYNLEAIVALQPDLVLAQGDGFTSPELIASLEGLGLTVYAVPNPATLEEMYANLMAVGTLTGHGSEAAALVASLQARVAVVDGKIATAAVRPTVYYETAAEPGKSYTVGPGSFIDGLITRAGGTNAAGNLDSQWPALGYEGVIVLNPQVIILGDAAWGESAETVAARPGWEAIAAVQTGMVFPIDDNLVSRPGPRLVDGLEALAKLLHPDLFK